MDASAGPWAAIEGRPHNTDTFDRPELGSDHPVFAKSNPKCSSALGSPINLFLEIEIHRSGTFRSGLVLSGDCDDDAGAAGGTFYEHWPFSNLLNPVEEALDLVCRRRNVPAVGEER